ncbi:MAG: AAA family ATPase [Anaerolineae bacterium]|nr:AAA family ATPase [Anaerolineae bacterium]
MRHDESKTKPLRIFCLGGLRFERHGVPWDSFKTRKVAALFVYIAATGKPQPRELLADLLWDDRSTSVARSNLRVALSDLRKHVGDWITITRHAVDLKVESDVWLDSGHLTRMLSADAFAPDALAGALELYHGDFLAGFHLSEARGFEAWASAERERLHQLALGGHRRLAAHYLERGQLSDGIAAAQRHVQFDSLDETAHYQLMQLLVANGQTAGALTQYGRCRALLAEELGVTPSAETIALADAIRAGQTTIVHAASVEPRHNLPPELTPFFGRNDELETVERLLEQPTARLITIIGAGGMGKTRLARAAARRFVKAGRFADGVYFVPLAAIEQSTQVVTTIADAIGLELSAEIDPAEQLITALRRKAVCLVLDNVEQIAGLPDLLPRLLRDMPQTTFLLTSRVRLQLRSEYVLEMRGLPFIPSNSTTTPAAALFMETAQRVRPDFAPDSAELNRICGLVEGTPLALELAAGWVDTLSLPAIEAAIREDLDILHTDSADLPSRQRSMRGVFETTWRQLSAPEQSLLAACSCFRGGFTRAAAEAICGATPRLLARLVRHSLLTFNVRANRYSMHELLRQFAADQLRASPQQWTDTRHNHSAYFTSWLLAQSDEITIVRRPLAETPIATELVNIQRAWRIALDLKFSQQMAPTVHLFGNIHMRLARFREGESIFANAVSTLEQWLHGQPNDRESRYLLAVVLAWQADFAHLLGLPQPITTNLHRSLELLQSSDLQGLTTDADLAHVYECLGDVSDGEDAILFYERGLEVAQRGAIPLAQASLLDALANARGLRGDTTAELMLLARQSHEIRSDIGDLMGLSWSAQLMAWIAIQAGDFQSAAEHAEDAITHSRKLKWRNGLANALHVRGGAFYNQGDWESAIPLFQEAIDLWREVGLDRASFASRYSLGMAQLGLGDEQAAKETTQAYLVSAKRVPPSELSLHGHVLAGHIDLLHKEWQSAVSNFDRVIPFFEQRMVWSRLAHALAFRALATFHCGEMRQAETMLQRAEQLLVKRNYPISYVGLVKAVRSAFLAQDGRYEEAQAMFQSACASPQIAKSQWYQSVIGRYIPG